MIAGRAVSYAPAATAPSKRTWIPTEFNCKFSVKLMGRARLAMVAVFTVEDASTVAVFGGS